MGTKLEKKDHKECSNCLGFQEIITKVNVQCTLLELDIKKKNSVIERLEDEVKLLKQKNENLEKSIRNGEEEEDTVLQLRIENKTLECEKKMAEIEVKALQAKYEELEMRLIELQKRSLEMDSIVQNENKANEDKDASGIPPINTPSKQYTDSDGVKGGPGCELKPSVRKGLDFANEGSSNFKDISPTTPGGGKPPFDPIYISDGDDDQNVELGITRDEKELTSKDKCRVVLEIESDEEEDIPCNYSRKRKMNNLSMPKKKRVSNIVTSDSESESDFNENGSSSKDNLKKRTRKRRLTRLGSGEEKGVLGNSPYKNTRSKKRFEIPTTKNDINEEDEIEEDDDSDSESLSEFIVKSDDEISEHDSTFSDDDSENCLDDLGSSISYKEIMCSLRREKKDMTWDYEADLLANLAKCSELCMKAVCALYRQQTSEEKSCKATIVRNGQGFNQIHALMGSNLAEFLTDGDPQSDVKKSVEELLEFDPKGVENCKKLASYYSKQLFEIYNNGTDPFFRP